MPKLQYNSDDDVVKSVSDNEIEPPQKPPKPSKKVNDVVNEPVKEVKEIKKEKKPRSEAQIEATNRMREQLKIRRENDMKLKEQARLEYEEKQKKIRQKLSKLTLKGKVEQKIKENRTISVSKRKDIREYALENFDWEKIIDKFIELF
jgi:hypothetical protein